MRDRALIDAVLSAPVFTDCRETVSALCLDTARRRPTRESAFVLCSWHSEKTPSCRLSLRSGRVLACCYGCQRGGSVLDVLAAVEGRDIDSDFPGVLRRAAQIAGVSLDTSDETRTSGERAAYVRATVAREPDPPALSDATFAAVVAPLLHVGRLDTSEIAADVLAYLDRRGVLAEAIADGWAALPRPEVQGAWVEMMLEAAEVLPDRPPPFTVDELHRAGILDKSGRRFAFADNRLIIPWRDPDGRVVNVQRRRIDDRDAVKYAGAKDRSFPWPYGIDRFGELPADATVAIVEGAVDVLALRALLAARGEPAIVVGLPGLAGWREAWASLARGRVAAVAVDADAAGERHVAQIANDLAAAGARRIERWEPPAKDWAQLVDGRAA